MKLPDVIARTIEINNFNIIGMEFINDAQPIEYNNKIWDKIAK